MLNGSAIEGILSSSDRWCVRINSIRDIPAHVNTTDSINNANYNTFSGNSPMTRFVCFLAIVVMAISSTVAADKVKSVSVGQTVPDFVVKDLQGKSWKLSDLQKRTGSKKRLPVVLSFWCATCDSCRHVEKRLANLAADFKGKAEVIALDSNFGETRREIEALLKKKKLSLRIMLDGSGTTADLFQARVTTTTIVIDANGVLRYHGQFGSLGNQFVRKALQAVLDNKEVRTMKTRPRG